ncbi:sulfur-oxidizing protein SoxY [Methylomagnum ishizawai]|uniref:Sulfur-oxidizing protein SoxY n=1 Tax=Methylomagnum ishizawai TaxID=1760988 RepID=A0A1Y6D4K2_9GAMM|nr:thiosulfate oxidation carrier protein SoxY [Methylomagnum ishizawai]SMF95793.1 sulfur-oxidizing protein SoxY [Methylomagnum ishizawai]
MTMQAQDGAGTRRGFLRWLAGWAAALAGGRPLWGAARSATAGGGDPPSGAFPAALAAVLGGRDWTESPAVALEVPSLAENGAIVPVTVESRLPDTTRLFIFAENNPGPLLARFDFEHGADGYASLRVKLNASGPVLALVEAGGRFYGASRQVRVMVGGCG